MDINTLRKMRENSSKNFGTIAAEFDKIANPSKGYKDDRFWKLEVDKSGNGTATIRFLDKVEGDKLPWEKVFSHAFQGPTGKWYIENSLTTIGQNDFIGEENSRLYNSGNEADKKLAQSRKRKLNYICNILVISDPKNPQNEGKVFLFKFGKKIFDKIMDKAQPTFEDEKKVNVFDYWNGADFKLRQKKVDGFPNYDASSFAEPSPITEDDAKLLSIVKAQYSLKEFTDPKNFKSYDELKAKYLNVVNAAPSEASRAEEMDDLPPVREARNVKEVRAVESKSISNDDDDMAYFRSIADDE